MKTETPPTPVILDDEQLQKIEARPYYYVGLARRVELHPDERDALCATVRALREQLAESDAIIKSYNDAEWKTNTALREQLAEETKRADENFTAYDRIKTKYSETVNRLAQVEKEREFWNRLKAATGKLSSSAAAELADILEKL